MCTCACVQSGHKQDSRWGPGPACIGGKSGSSSVWQPTDLEVWGAVEGGAGPSASSSRGPAPALWTPGEPRGIAEGPRVEGVGRLGGGEELLAEASL